MHKKTVAAVIACVLGIVLLAGLAFFILNIQSSDGDLLSVLFPGSSPALQETEQFSGFIFSTEEEETETSVTHAPVKVTEAQTEAPLPDQTETEYSAEKYTADHAVIFVGDSRTLGMRDAIRRSGLEGYDVFVGKVGEGVRWFREEGKDEMARAIEANPDLPVVLNLGVNDPVEIDDYIVTYWDCVREHPDTDFYILSVNPIDEEFLIESETAAEEVLDIINNLNIAKLNIRLKEEFSDRYLDSSSYLKSNGFDTVDGLHYSTGTYLKIHDFVTDELF